MTVPDLLLAASLALAPTASAAQDDQPLPVRAGQAIVDHGFYQSPSAEVDGDALASMTAGHRGFGFVVLANEPVEDSIEFADDVLDAASAAPLIHTVVVVSPTDYGAVSTRYSDEAIDAAFEDVVDTLRTDRVAGLDAFADRVPSAGPRLSESESESDDGGSFPIGWVLLVVAIVGGAWLLKVLGVTGGSGGEYDGDDDSGSWSSRRRRSSWSRRSFSSGRSGSSRRSSSRSSGGRRGRGGGRF